MRLSFAAAAAFAGLAAAVPTANHAVHEKINGQPIAWTKGARAPKNQPLPVRVALKQRNLDNLDQYVDEVADPDSPNFGME